MIKIGDTLVSEDLMEVAFVCELNSCLGACCVEGDSGAPLEADELPILEEIYPIVREYLSPASRGAIRQEGVWVEDGPGDYETPLVDGKECAYVVFDGGKAFCGIEKAYLDGRISFQKPISCHLYPVRIHKLASIEVEAVNYESWSICAAACTLGKELQVPLYKFLEAPLTRKFGADWYAELCEVFAALKG